LNITMIGEEHYYPYNRIMLSEVLAGQSQYSSIVTHHPKWFEKNSVNFIHGQSVSKIDTIRQVVHIQDELTIPYNYLVVATGSQPFVPPIPGIDHPKVVSYRDLADVFQMIQLASEHQKMTVMGGGLLGLEAAWGLRARGLDVAIVHLMDRLMEKQIDGPASKLLEKHFLNHGIELYLAKKTSLIDEQNDQLNIHFADGSSLSTDFLVVATGIQPNIELARTAGIACQRGILVDETMCSSVEDVFAIGECVEFQKSTVGLVSPVYEMAKVAATQILEKCGKTTGKTYQLQDTLTKLKVSGVDLSSAGIFEENDATDSLRLCDDGLGLYRKIVIKDNRIQGFVCYGDQEHVDWYYQLMQESTDIYHMRSHLLFGPKSDTPKSGFSAVIAMSDDEEVCGCQGVSKAQIIGKIAEKNLCSLKEVAAHTKASTGCGSCKVKVNSLLQWYLETEKGQSVEEQKETICGCTDLSHEEVRQAIKGIQVNDLMDALQQMNWKNVDGCQKCRPAVNYYLMCEFPDSYQDHSASRLVNERNHANIQRDGTYSVVPRMFGGLTSAAELRLLADVVDDYQIPCVKVTGGQRVDLLGVKKEDLHKIWQRLGEGGMVSGHAYGKAVRTVKTCVGSEWCRFGTQDSTSMGVQIERLTWGAWTPHKVKMAVSGCPRNCAESTIKDLGVIAVDSGWEISVGGNGGIKVRVAEFLCKVTTMPEVLEFVGAFLQYYREDARYLERTAHWLERIGLAKVKTKLVDDQSTRKELYQKFLDSQANSQVDPWRQEVEKAQMSHHHLN